MHNTDKYCKLFFCPICKSSMSIKDKSLVCQRSHCYDISKSGYINFLSKPVNSGYNKSLWDSRRNINKAGAFDPLINTTADTLNSHFPSVSSGYILDAGCGEGTYLKEIVGRLNAPLLGAGIDLSKEAVITASKSYKNQLWSVGDLANTPFKDESFLSVLNILSPANYKEFYRVLAKNGMLIKVIPGSNYLKELREIFYKDDDKSEYSNHSVVQLFKDSFSFTNNIKLTYSFNLTSSILYDFINMTPLSWNVNINSAENLLSYDINSITMDFNILVGIK